MRAEINLKGPNAFDRFRELNVCGNIATINSEEDFPILIDQIKETKIKKIQIYPNNLQTCYYREDGWEIVIRQEIWK